MLAIFRKEMKIYLGGMFGYIITALLLLFTGFFVALFHLLSDSADFSLTLVAMQWVLIILIPFMSMRAVAEERHSRTDQLLYSLPIRLRDVVLGKFFALTALFLIPTAFTALYPLILSTMGNISLPAAYTALLGYILMTLALIAFCMFISSLVENQILAAVLSIAAVLALYLMDTITSLLPVAAVVSFLICIAAELGLAALVWRWAKNLTLGMLAGVALILPTCLLYIIKADLFRSLVPNFLAYSNVFTRFNGFSYGYLDLSGVIFYLSFTVVFLFLTVQSMEKRRRA